MKTLTQQEITLVQGAMSNSEIAVVAGLTLVGAGLGGGVGLFAIGTIPKIWGASHTVMGIAGFIGAGIGGLTGGYFTEHYAENWVAGR